MTIKNCIFLPTSPELAREIVKMTIIFLNRLKKDFQTRTYSERKTNSIGKASLIATLKSTSVET